MAPGSAAALESPLEHEIDPDVQRQLLDHPGKWAAITRSEIIAIGDSPKAVFEEAVRQGVAHVILFHVPEDAKVVFFF